MTRKYIHEQLVVVAQKAANYGFAVGQEKSKSVTDKMLQELFQHIEKFGDEVFVAVEAKDPKCPHKSLMMP